MAWARFIPFLLVITLLVLPAAANPVLEAGVGWGDRYRPDRWTPAYARVQAPVPTAAIFEWYVPRPGHEAMVIRQQFTINPTPGVVRVYLPVGPDPVALHLRITDARSGRTLGHWPPELVSPEAWIEAQVREPIFVGVTGAGPALRFLAEEVYAVAFLTPELLPRRAIGFDGLDVLALNQPQLAALDRPKQEAILAWVRAGGRVVMWLDSQVVPPDAPLAELLPGPVVEFTTVQIAGAPVRMTRIQGIDAEQLVTRRAVGLGQAIFLHVPPEAAVAAGVSFMPEGPMDPLVQAVELDAAALEPVARAAEPRYGGFVRLMAVALLIGPVDWFVMRRARRRSRPWITLPGWIGVFALLIWYMPAGPHEQHDVRLVTLDVGEVTLAAGATVATTGGTGLPEDENIRRLEEIGGVYWTTLGYQRTGGPIRDIVFHFGDDGMRPGGMTGPAPAFVGHGVVFRQQ